MRKALFILLFLTSSLMGQVILSGGGGSGYTGGTWTWRVPPLMEVTGCNYTVNGVVYKIVKTGAFASYTWQADDYVRIIGGTGLAVHKTSTAQITASDEDSLTLSTDINTGGGSILDGSVHVMIAARDRSPRFILDGRAGEGSHTPVFKFLSGSHFNDWTCGAAGIDGMGALYTAANLYVTSEHVLDGGVPVRIYPRDMPVADPYMCYIASDMNGPSLVLGAGAGNARALQIRNTNRFYTLHIDQHGTLYWADGTTRTPLEYDVSLRRGSAGMLQTNGMAFCVAPAGIQTAWRIGTPLTASTGTGLACQTNDNYYDISAGTTFTTTGGISPGRVLLSIQLNIETEVTGTGGAGDLACLGLGTAGDPTLYGVTTTLAQNQKINTLISTYAVVVPDAISLRVTGMQIDGTTPAVQTMAGGRVRVKTVYLEISPLEDAPTP